MKVKSNKVDMTTGTDKLTQEEKDLLKKEIRGVWSEFPEDMKKFIVETQKQKLQSLYMIQDWAKNNGHEIIVGLISRKIQHKEECLAKAQKELEK